LPSPLHGELKEVAQDINTQKERLALDLNLGLVKFKEYASAFLAFLPWLFSSCVPNSSNFTPLLRHHHRSSMTAKG
jgi:hypothetical protein